MTRVFAQDDPAAGQAVFDQKCASCHTVTADLAHGLLGPNLVLKDGVGRVVLPDALEKKYPNAATEWAWQFVFPASRVCGDPRLAARSAD